LIKELLQTKININNITSELIHIAQNAGDSIMAVYKKETFNQQLKSDNILLTEADIASHNIIVNNLRQLTLDIPVLSEESKFIPWNERKQWNKYWLIDPLNGTKEFVKKWRIYD
jgi:3'(2'), 5'-bisphosphate nucleotidase